MDGLAFKATLRDLVITQRWLAAELGVALPTISNWARGLYPVPKYVEAYLGLLAQVRKSDAKKSRRKPT